MHNNRKSRHGDWFKKHSSDPFVKRAHSMGYRARSAFKLLEIEYRDRVFKGCHHVVDLGAAPGAWSQLARKRIPKTGRVFALDIAQMPPLPGVDFIQGDFRENSVLEKLNTLLGTYEIHLVMSDMAPNIGGIRVADQAHSMELAELAAEFAHRRLASGGTFLIKLFQGFGIEEYLKMLRQTFSNVLIRKPDASRLRSREFYVLARGYRV